MLAYRYHSIEPEGVWTSEPFPSAERRHIVQGVRGGYIMGRPRWAEDLDGNFIYGLDAKGKEMSTAPVYMAKPVPRRRGKNKPKVKISTSRPIGWTVTDPARPGWSETGTTTSGELKEAFPKRHHATKKSSAQLQREIDEVLANKPSSSARDQQLAEAIDLGERERAAELYGVWTSQYSNEDRDRVSGLAGRLTAIDRQEGRSAPPVGSSRLRLDQAEEVVRDANSYSAFQQGLSAQRRARR